MRIAALDFGMVRIGVAISDERTVIAQPLCVVLKKKRPQDTAKLIVDTLRPYYPLKALIMGNPLLLNGKESPLCQEIKPLVEILKQLLEIPVILWDERLTTALVERALKEGDMSRKKRAQHVDVLSATVILQSYMEHCSFQIPVFE